LTVGANRAWQQRIDTNSRRELVGERFREAADSAADTVAERQPADGLFDARRGDEQDRARVGPAQRRQRCLNEMHRTHEGESIRGLEFLVVQVREHVPWWAACIDNECIESPEFGHCALDSEVRLLGIGNICDRGDDPATVRADCFGSNGQWPRRACAHPDIRSLGRELFGDCSTHALARRCDECGTSSEPEIHGIDTSSFGSPIWKDVRALSAWGVARQPILGLMLGEFGKDWSLPLLPAGSSLFDALPVGALVLDALAPAIGNGMITMSDGRSEGALVVRDGVLAERIWLANGVRSEGDEALALMRSANAATVSARRLTDDAMVLLGPLLKGTPCYTDLHLEWMVWSQFRADLCARGRTYVVEVTTLSGRGVTCIRGGRQVATFVDSHPALGEASLLDDIAAVGVGTVRVLVDDGSPGDAAPSYVSGVARRVADVAHHEPVTAVATESAPVAAVEAFVPRDDPRPASVATDDPNATFSAMFGTHHDTSSQQRLIALDHTRRGADRDVAAVLPQLRLLVQHRLQRSSVSVEEIVESAAIDHHSVGWLSDRVRVMTMRGFLHSTFDQLADDMLALAGRDPG
jgi:hypothetical protein